MQKLQMEAASASVPTWNTNCFGFDLVFCFLCIALPDHKLYICGSTARLHSPQLTLQTTDSDVQYMSAHINNELPSSRRLLSWVTPTENTELISLKVSVRRRMQEVQSHAVDSAVHYVYCMHYL